LRLITRLNVGGPARQALLLTRELRDDYPTRLVAGTPPAYEGELADPEVPVTRIPLVREMSPLRDIRSLATVRRLIREGEPSILHTHMAKAGSVGRLAALSMRSRPKLVHTFHGHVLEGYFSGPAQKGFTRIERFLATRTDACVAVSNEVRDSLLELGIGNERNWHVIPLGFDLDPFLAVEAPSGHLRAKLGLGSDVPLLGVIGRLAPIKDHSTLLKALTLLDGVHLAVLGDGELRNDIEGRAAALGIGDRVHFVGWWLDVASAIADLDVTVLSSRNEGTPVSLIESLASARPVVATDVGGVASVVADRATGFLVDAGDHRGFASRVKELLDSPELRNRFGSAGRVSVRERYSKERLLADVRALYGELTP
jgi:glycosyltransferase involved in cell wall biosynthesis